MLSSHQQRNLLRINLFQRNTVPINVAILLFTLVVNFTPGSIIYAVL